MEQKKTEYIDWLRHASKIKEHIYSEHYYMTCCTSSQYLGEVFFLALKQRGMMPKLKDVRSWRDFKCWLLGHIILSINY